VGAIGPTVSCSTGASMLASSKGIKAVEESGVDDLIDLEVEKLISGLGPGMELPRGRGGLPPVDTCERVVCTLA